MTNKVATEVGDNWSVFFFQCSTKKLKRVLVDLFHSVREIKKAKIPHFTIREGPPPLDQKFGISIRVLRDQDDAEIVDYKLAKFFEQENLYWQSDPKGNRHAWISKGKTDSTANRSFCEALNQLSNFVVFLAQYNIFSTDRGSMAHLLINMLAMREATVLGSNQVYFWDAINGEKLTVPTLLLPDQKNKSPNRSLS